VARASAGGHRQRHLAFERLFLTVFSLMLGIRTIFAGNGCDAERHRNLCLQFGAGLRIQKRNRPRGSGDRQGR
jgi:hypothetical protein